MSEFLSSQDAINRIRILDETGELTEKNFNETISRIDPGASSGKTTVVYSGSVTPVPYGADVSPSLVPSTNGAAQSIARQAPDSIRIINNSGYSEVLENPEVIKAYLNIPEIKANFDIHKGNEWAAGYANPETSPWAAASRALASSAEGDIIAFTSYADDGRVFAVDELPNLLENEKVNSINGISRESLMANVAVNADGTKDYSQALDEINVKSQELFNPNNVEIATTDVNGRIETVTIFNENAFKSIDLEVPSDFNPSVVTSIGENGNIQFSFDSATKSSILNGIDKKQGLVGTAILGDIIHSTIKLISEQVDLSEMSFDQKVELILSSSNLEKTSEFAKEIAKEIAVETGASVGLRVLAGPIGAAVWSAYEASQNYEALDAMASLGLKVDPDNPFYLKLRSTLDFVDDVLGLDRTEQTIDEKIEFLEKNIPEQEQKLIEGPLYQQGALVPLQSIIKDIQRQKEELETLKQKKLELEAEPAFLQDAARAALTPEERILYDEYLQSRLIATTGSIGIGAGSFNSFQEYLIYKQGYLRNSEDELISPDQIDAYAEATGLSREEAKAQLRYDDNKDRYLSDEEAQDYADKHGMSLDAAKANARFDFNDDGYFDAREQEVREQASQNTLEGTLNEAGKGLSSLSGLYDALQADDNFEALAQLVNFLVVIEDLLDRGGDGLLADEAERNFEGIANVLNSAFRLEQALDADDDVLAALYAVDLADEVFNLFSSKQIDGKEVGFLDNQQAAYLGVALSIYGLYQAIQEGDDAAIAVAAFQTANSISAATVGKSIPYASYVTSAYAVHTSLEDGDEVGAIIAALNFIPVWGWILSLAISIDRAGTQKSSTWKSLSIGDETEKYYLKLSNYVNDDEDDHSWTYTVLSPNILVAVHQPLAALSHGLHSIAGWLGAHDDPHATLTFIQNEDGSFGYAVDSNKTGRGYKDFFHQTPEGSDQTFGEGLSQTLDSFNRAYGSAFSGGINTSHLPTLRVSNTYGSKEKPELQFVGGGNLDDNVVNSLGKIGEFDPSLIGRYMEHMLFAANLNDAWVVGTQADGSTVYDPMGIIAAFSQPSYTQGIPIGPISQGEQTQGRKELIEAKDEDITTVKGILDVTLPSTLKTLQREHQTWRVDKNLFAGESGQLLAMGLATGVVSIQEVALAAYPTVEEINLATDERYAQIVADFGSFITSNGVFGNASAFDVTNADNAQSAIAARDEYSEDISQFYSRRPDTQTGESGSTNDDAGNSSDSGSSNNANNNGDDASSQNPVTFGDVPLEFRDPTRPDVAAPDYQTFSENAAPIFEREAGVINEEIVDPDAPFTHQAQVLEDRELWFMGDSLMQSHPDYDPAWVFLRANEGVNGSLVLHGANQDEVQFVPDADFHGKASFSYTVIDHNGATRTIGVNITVSNDNDRPEAVDDAFLLVEDERFDLAELLKNDIDTDNDALRIVGVSAVSVGQIVVIDDKAMYQPPKDYVGDVTFSYVIEDVTDTANPKRSVATSVLIYQEGENDAPIVSDTVFDDGVEDHTYHFTANDLLLNARDVEGDELRITDIQLVDASQGSVSFNPMTGEIEFIPAAQLSGDVQLTYDVTDFRDAVDAFGAPIQEMGETTQGTLTIQLVSELDSITASDDAITIDEDAQTLFTQAQLLSMVDNPGGEDVTVAAVRMVSGEQGQVHLLGNGDVLFIPAPEFSGDTAFELRFNAIDGGAADRVSARIDVTVTAVADAPNAVNDTLLGGVEEQDFQFNVSALLANDVDSEGDAFGVTAIALADASQGSLSVDLSTGEVVFSPAADVFGQVEFVYTVTEDISGLSSQGKATLEVINVNDKPVARLLSGSDAEDQTQVFTKASVLADYAPDYQDIDGETLSLANVSLSDASAGTVGLNVFGDIVFIPADNYVGNVTINYHIDDGVMPVDGSIAVAVTPENDAPIAVTDSLTGAVEETEFTFQAADLLVNDTDVEDDVSGDALTLTAVRLKDTSQGVVSFDQATGEIRFVPSAHVFGAVAFEYDVQDSQGATSTGEASLDVQGTDDGFMVADSAIDLIEDEVKTFSKSELISDYESTGFKELDGELLNVTAARVDAAQGSVMLTADGGIEFIPANQFAGVASIEYDVSDGVSTQTVTITATITAENDAPTANEDILTGGTEEQSFTFNIADILANDSDEEGDAFSLTGIRLQDPAQGTLTLDELTGEVVFEPADDVFGEVAFEYDLEDVNGNVGTGVSKIVLDGVDDPFLVNDKDYRTQAFNVTEDEVTVFAKADLLQEYADTGFKDTDGEELTISNVVMSNAALGSVVLLANGDIEFTPTKDHTGEAAFSFDVTDGNTVQAVTVNTKTWGENDAPEVVADARAMTEDDTLTVSGASLLANDRDAEGDSFKITGIWNTSAGTASYDAVTDTVTYTPEKDHNTESGAPAWVDYLVEDSQGAFSVARMNVDIANSDDPVMANADTLNANEDEVTFFNASSLLDNDTNLDQEALTIQSIDTTGVTQGVVELLADGTIRYNPAAEYHGEQTFNYTVRDESGNESTAEVLLTTHEVNDAPEAVLEAVTLKEDTSITFETADLLTNITDVEDDWVSIVGARSRYGTVDFNEFTGQIHFTPTQHFNSPLAGENALLEYLVVDERGAETWAPIEINVTPVNDPPVGNDDLLFAWEAGPGGYTNQVSTGAFLLNDEEFDGEVIFVDQVTSADHGTTQLLGNQVSYRADDGFVGRDSFDYRVSDGMTNEDGSPSVDMATVTVEVVDNTAPIASDFAVIAAEDTILQFDWDQIAPNVFDVDSGHLQLQENLRVVEVDNAVNGTVELVNGVVNFNPTQNYNSEQFGGVASFTYTVEDVVGHRSTATASITYTPVNDAPDARSEALGDMDEDGAGFSFTKAQVLLNDSDVDGDSIDAINFRLADPNSGTLDESGGTYTFVPERNWNGTARVVYDVTDGELSTPAVAEILVNPINDPPWIRSVSGTAGPEDENNFHSIAGSFGDIDGDNVRIVDVSGTNGISAQASGSGIRWSDASPGTGTISYRVFDGQEYSDYRSFSVTTIAVPKPPVITSYSIGIGSVDYDGEDIKIGLFGAIAVNDPDGNNSNLTYSTETRYWDIGATNGSFNGEVHTYDYNGYRVSSHVVFTVRDEQGLLISRRFDYTISSVYGVSTTINFAGRTASRPIVLDLDNNGLNLLAAQESVARFDWDGDGDRDEHTGWIAGLGDGILAYDHDGDGKVTQSSEISFVDYADGAKTDLEGLRAFDSNGDGFFTEADALWSDFGVWVDDGDALGDVSEFITLADVGVASINLFSDENQTDMNGNVIHGMTDVLLTDGSTIQAGDVSFAVESDGITVTEVSTEIIDTSVSDALNEEEAVAQDDNQNEAVEDSAGIGITFDESASESNDAGANGLENSQTSAGLSDADVLAGLPDDDELDRRLLQGISDQAATQTETSVTPVSDDPESVTAESVTNEKDEDLVIV